MAENKLIAKCPILYLSKLYEGGEELPSGDSSMVSAWLEAGTAAWVTESETTEAPKAKAVTATPGNPGYNSTGTETDGDDLVGKVPKTPARRKKG